MPILTIFTPAYNRAHTLPRTYASLQRQDCKDFIWLVVDDGSSDNTSELVKSWQAQEKEFEIRYIYKENGGMHTAHNTAYENIDTELNVCIDSDDELADGAVRCILDLWKKIDHKKYAGIIGLDADMNTGKVIGTDFPANMKETTLAGFYDAGGRGDKKLVYRTDLMKALPPYPVFEGEKYVSLGWKYQLCDQKYRLVTTNTVLCNVEYQADGSSMNMLRQYLRNPNGFAFIRKENMKYITDFKRNVIDAIHYCSSSQLAHNRNYIKESPKPLLTLLCTPAGCLLTAYIKHKTKD
ncbi:MAG: glycosyltransferase family 2 protein [Lachnospiraceae bacterium]